MTATPFLDLHHALCAALDGAHCRALVIHSEEIGRPPREDLPDGWQEHRSDEAHALWERQARRALGQAGARALAAWRSTGRSACDTVERQVDAACAAALEALELRGGMLGGSLPDLTRLTIAVCSVGEADVRGLARLAGEEGAPAREQGAPPADYVTLDMVANYLRRGKRTLERLKGRKRDPLPAPDLKGGGGRPDEWLWATLRPWLAREFRRELPERFPSFVPR